jgi:putative ABC transport system substrate-binding protein
MAVELAQKRLELISELVPHAGVIALLTNPKNPIGELVIRAVQAAADVKGVKLAVLKASTGDEIESAFVSLVQLQAAALIVDDERFFSSRRSQLIALASRHAIPTIYSTPNFAANGGLISYGISDAPIAREAGTYAGRILKGAKPADLPVQQPTAFELIVNLQTAKTLGLPVPQSIVALADEVLE